MTYQSILSKYMSKMSDFQHCNPFILAKIIPVEHCLNINNEESCAGPTKQTHCVRTQQFCGDISDFLRCVFCDEKRSLLWVFGGLMTGTGVLIYAMCHDTKCV